MGGYSLTVADWVVIVLIVIIAGAYTAEMMRIAKRDDPFEEQDVIVVDDADE